MPDGPPGAIRGADADAFRGRSVATRHAVDWLPCGSSRDRRGQGGRRALAAGRPRRRDDASREAAHGARFGGPGPPGPRRCPQGVALVSATNGKTTTTAMTAEILRSHAPGSPTTRAGANLVSGIASALVESRGRRARPLRGRRGSAARARARSCAAAGLPRESVPRPARPLRRARDRRRALGGGARAPAGRLAGDRERRRPRRWRPSRRAGPPSSASASTTRRPVASGPRTPPTRSTAGAAAPRSSTRPRTSDISATTAARAAGPHVRRSTSSPGPSSHDGLDGSPFDLHTPAGRAADRRWPVPASTTSTTPGAAALAALELGRHARRDRRRARPLSALVRTLRADRGGRPHGAAAARSRTRRARTRRCGRSSPPSRSGRRSWP